MSAALTLKFNTRDVARRFKAVADRVPHATARALNRAGTTMRAVMAREISRDTGLKVGTVKNELIVTNATPAKTSVRVSVSGARIPLIEFNARGPEPSRGRGRGVTARLKGGRGRYPHAFISTMRSGHRGVFQRRGSGRLPIDELEGPSLPWVFRKVSPSVREAGVTALAKNLASEINYELRKVGKMPAVSLGSGLKLV